MRPYCCLTMYFCTALVIWNAPRRCTFMTVSQSSSVILYSMLSRITPALLTSTVGSPSSWATRSTAAWTWLRSLDVGSHRQRMPAVVGDLLHRPGARRLVQIKDGHGHPILG